VRRYRPTLNASRLMTPPLSLPIRVPGEPILSLFFALFTRSCPRHPSQTFANAERLPCDVFAPPPSLNDDAPPPVSVSSTEEGPPPVHASDRLSFQFELGIDSALPYVPRDPGGTDPLIELEGPPSCSVSREG
jgi:hypothetical protein